uniref:Putative 8.9kda 9 8.9 kDa family n=1 Tax=Hyalomma excavatum TaxID=257692 RepID=A0A131XKV0_9ACAR
MNVLPIVLLILNAQITNLIRAERRIWPLTIVNNNTCQYGPYGLPDSICLDVAHPCVSLCCTAESSQLSISGCPLPSDFDNSTFDGFKYWPNCCVENRHLPKPPSVPVALYYAKDGSWRYRYETITNE